MDPFVYAGTGGNVFVYYHLYQFYKSNPKYDHGNLVKWYLSKSVQALKTNAKIVEAYEDYGEKS